uniref:Uncharacterized protein n=1 Tax=Oryza brachyantha TaxID=4533 RepID=J3LP71_ORYBR
MKKLKKIRTKTGKQVNIEEGTICKLQRRDMSALYATFLARPYTNMEQKKNCSSSKIRKHTHMAIELLDGCLNFFNSRHCHKSKSTTSSSQRKRAYTSTISTEPACSKSPASWALSTLKGRLPTKTLRSSENSSSASEPSSSCSVSTSSETATASGRKG